MNTYHIKTAEARHFIIQADTSEKAMSLIATPTKHVCPWTKSILLEEPKLRITYCARLPKTS